MELRVSPVRSILFWDFMHSRMAVSCRRFGITYRSHFKGQADSLTLKDGTDRFSRNFVRNYCYTLLKIAKERNIFFFMDMSQIAFVRRNLMYITQQNICFFPPKSFGDEICGRTLTVYQLYVPYWHLF